MIIHQLANGDKVNKYSKCIVLHFTGKRNVISTSILNGGYREDLLAVFNKDENPDDGTECTLKAPTYKEHMELIVADLGLDSRLVTGMTTSASMDNVAIVTEKFKGLSVSAIATGGVEINGGRVGDKASFYEDNEKIEMIKMGTINIFLYIDANLSPGILSRAMVTCTEAKTAALQELMAGSNYSRGIATGSGTDGVIAIANLESELILTNAGKHSKLGELIGLTVKKAVKEALYLQNGLSAKSQHSILKRLKRFGINEETLWQAYLKLNYSNTLTKAEFVYRLNLIEVDRQFVVLVSLIAHLIDQADWELLALDSAIPEIQVMLKRIADYYGVVYLIDNANINWVNATIETTIIQVTNCIATIIGTLNIARNA